jgi:hypothetical protein
VPCAARRKVVRGDPDDAAIAVVWADSSKEGPRTMALGTVKREIMPISAGSEEDRLCG